jgi:hypothetical protein
MVCFSRTVMVKAEVPGLVLPALGTLRMDNIQTRHSHFYCRKLSQQKVTEINMYTVEIITLSPEFHPRLQHLSQKADSAVVNVP